MKKQRYGKISTDCGLYLRTLKPRNAAQEFYVELLKEMTIVLSKGPAGVGKTLFATYVALELFLAGEVQKIILTRPMVATEDIGYLPGTAEEKIDPYMKPLFDALEIHLGPVKLRDLLEDGTIEIAPLAFMRGRTLNNAFIILDEAQNATVEQVKMFITRLGFESKMVINGDVTQIDLPKGTRSGFEPAFEKLRGCDSVGVIEFQARDIVRNPLLEKVLARLEGPDDK